jgi:hypothetical protein
MLVSTSNWLFAFRRCSRKRAKIRANHASRVHGIGSASRQKRLGTRAETKEESRKRPFEQPSPYSHRLEHLVVVGLSAADAWINAADCDPTKTHCERVPPRRDAASSNESRCFSSVDSNRACRTNPAALSSWRHLGLLRERGETTCAF